ncbi:MAG: hypothetical protein AAGI90_07020 [Chlamydiota bacterium]
MSSLTSISTALEALRKCAPPVTFQSKSALQSSEKKGACVTSSEERSVSVFTLNGNYLAVNAARSLYVAMKERQELPHLKGFNTLRHITMGKLKTAHARRNKDLSQQVFCLVLMVASATGKIPDFYALARQHRKENRIIHLIVTQKSPLNPSAPETALNVLRKFFEVLSLLREEKKITAPFCHTTTHPHLSTLIKRNRGNYTIVHSRHGMSNQLFQTHLKEESKTDYHYLLEKLDNKHSSHPVKLARILVLIRPANGKPFPPHLMPISRSEQRVSSEKKSSRSNRLKQSNAIGTGSFFPVYHTPHQHIPSQGIKSANTLRFEEVLKQLEKIYEDSQKDHMLQTETLVIVVSRLAAKSRDCVDQIIRGETGSQCAPHPSNLWKNRMKKHGEKCDHFLFLEGPLQEKTLRPKSLALLKSQGRIMKIYPYFKETDRNDFKQSLIVKKFLELAGYLSNKDSNKSRYIQVFASNRLLNSLLDGSVCRLPNHVDNTSLPKLFDDFLTTYRYCWVTNPITGEITSLGTKSKQRPKEKFLQEFTPIHPLAPSQKLTPSSRENSETHACLGTKESSAERKNAPFCVFDLPVPSQETTEDAAIRSMDTKKKS